MKLLAADATEQDCVQAGVLIFRMEELPIQSDPTLVSFPEGCVDLSGAGEKPVQFERQKGARTCGATLLTGEAHRREHLLKAPPTESLLQIDSHLPDEDM